MVLHSDIDQNVISSLELTFRHLENATVQMLKLVGKIISMRNGTFLYVKVKLCIYTLVYTNYVYCFFMI